MNIRRNRDTCVIARVGYHKEGVDKRVFNTRIWAKWRQGVQGGSYPRQCSLCQGSRRIPIKAILFNYIEGLPKRREHLWTFLGSHAPPKDGQHLPQIPPGEANSDISTLRPHSAHGQTNNLVPRKAETRMTNKMHYKAYQVKQPGRIWVSVVLKPKICLSNAESAKESVW